MVCTKINLDPSINYRYSIIKANKLKVSGSKDLNFKKALGQDQLLSVISFLIYLTQFMGPRRKPMDQW